MPDFDQKPVYHLNWNCTFSGLEQQLLVPTHTCGGKLTRSRRRTKIRRRRSPTRKIAFYLEFLKNEPLKAYNGHKTIGIDHRKSGKYTV